MNRDWQAMVASYLWFTAFLACPILLPAPVILAQVYFGGWAGIPAAIVVLPVFSLFLRSCFRFFDRQAARFRDDARERYRRIFRVVALPADKKSCDMPHGAEIRIGDYGWEAQPLRKNGLIYLQGLTEQWLVVWHAGFRPDEIEYVGQKPVSQYDWRDFKYIEGSQDDAVWGRPCKLETPCLFPVQPRRGLHAMGFPEHW